MTATRTSSRQLAQWLCTAGFETQTHGPADAVLTDVAPLAAAGPTDLTYAESDTQVAAVAASAAACVLVPQSLAEAFATAAPDRAILGVADAQAAFIAAMMRFRPARPMPQPKVALDAYIAPTAKLGDDCHIGANVSIAEGCVLGDGCILYPGVHLGENCTLGDGCILHPGVVLYADTRMRDRVIVHANSVIGADGFGYRFEAGRFDRIPHTGGVVVGSDVEIGACSTIDRGMIGDTVIGDGTKLDNHVQVAHNCQIGPHNVAAAMVGLAGSVTTGAYVRFGGNSGVKEHCTIGDQANIGAKAAIIDDVPAQSTYHGVPAKPASEALRQLSMVKKLPEMRRQIRELQDQLAALEATAPATRRAA